MAIASMAATTVFLFFPLFSFFVYYLSTSFVSFADSAGLLFDARKCTALTSVPPYLRIRVSDSTVALHRNSLIAAVAFAGSRHFRRRKLSLVKLEIYMSGGEDAEKFSRTLSFMKKTSCFVAMDAVDIDYLHRRGEIADLVLKNLNPRIKFDEFGNFHHVFPSEIENRRPIVEISSDLEEQKHDSSKRLRRRVLQIGKKTKELSDLRRSTAAIVTVPSTFPENTAAAAAAAAAGGDPTVMVPSTIPGVNVPGMAGSYSPEGWCVEKKGAVEEKLQEALDYACGDGGADCREIQVGGSCYNPNTVQSHASYAFNMYYQSRPSPSSCDFHGSAEIVNTNPSTETCVYPSSSSTSSPETTSPFPPPPPAQSVMPRSPFPATSTTPSGTWAGGGGFSNNGATTTTPTIIGSDNSQPQPSLVNNSSGNVVRRPAMNTKLFALLMLILSLFFAHNPCDETIVSVMQF